MIQAANYQLEDRLDELAAELLVSPAYQRTSWPAARKQAAGRFLIPHADGFSRRRASATSCTPGSAARQGRPGPSRRDVLSRRADGLIGQDHC